MKIREYLQGSSLDFYEGLELYSSNPGKRANLVMSFNKQYNKQSVHERLIYELEKMAEMPSHSNRTATLNHSPANVPYKLVEKTKLEAPEDYEYKVKYEDLPEDLKKLVIIKGQLYDRLQIAKKEMAAVGQKNDQESIDARKEKLDEMHGIVGAIKDIHATLLEFEKGGFDSAQPPGRCLSGAEGSELEESDELENEFHYKNMGYYERKDLLKRLHSAVIKQEQRASESNKANIVEKNKQAAELGRRMIAELQNYFKENTEPK